MNVFLNVTPCYGRIDEAAVRTDYLSPTLAWVSFCELTVCGGIMLVQYKELGDTRFNSRQIHVFLIHDACKGFAVRLKNSTLVLYWFGEYTSPLLHREVKSRISLLQRVWEISNFIQNTKIITIIYWRCKFLSIAYDVVMQAYTQWRKKYAFFKK